MRAKLSEAAKLKRDAAGDPAAEAQWRPWGLYDDRQVRPISGPVLDQAARLLGISDDKAKTASLAQRLRVTAVTYWTLLAANRTVRTLRFTVAKLNPSRKQLSDC